MARFKVWFLVVAILGLSGCTYEVNMHDDDNDELGGMLGPSGGLLDKPGTKAALLGDSRQFTPGTAPAGVLRFQQDFGWITTSAESISNAQLVTLSFDGFPLDFDVNAEADITFWQLVFNYGTGNALSGAGDVTTGVVGPITDENVVDIGLGSSICVPPNFLTMKVRFVGYQGGGFPGVHKAGSAERISITMGYGNKTNTQRSTKTDLWGRSLVTPFGVNTAVLANNGQTVFARAKYANAVQFTWAEYITATPCRVDFATPDGSIVTSVTLTGNVTPPPVIAWPEPAFYAIVTNLTGGNIRDIRAQNYLDL